MLAGTCGGVIGVGGAAIVIIAIRWGNEYMLAGACGGVVGVGGAT